MIKKFRELKRKGTTPCPWCGDVFPTHGPEQCPNHPCLNTGDQGFKAAYDACIVDVLEQLQAMANRIDEGETAVDAYPSCTESEDHHNWRSCLKRMKCHRNPEGKWEMQPPLEIHEASLGAIKRILVKIVVLLCLIIP